jgi:hypothetical protein
MSYWLRIRGKDGRLDAISFQGLPLVFVLGRRTLAVLLLLVGLGVLALALAGCGSDGVEAPPPPEAPVKVAGARPSSSALLLDVDLSEAAAAGMSREELWALGARLLAWPAELPADVTKEEVHRRLLEAKYRDLGDFGYTDRPTRGTGYLDSPPGR